MDTAQSVTKRGRLRSKSISQRLNSPTDLNGEKNAEMEGDKEGAVVDKSENPTDTSAEEVKADKSNEEMLADQSKEDEKVDKPIQGRKRKASELKSNDLSLEEPPLKDKPTPESELKTDQKVSGESSPNESPSESRESRLLQSLRKGKRARIPNKRYSDLPLVSGARANSSDQMMETDLLTPNFENGETKENMETESSSVTDVTIKEEPFENSSAFSSPSVPSVRANRTSLTGSPATPTSRKVKSVDLSNPNYLKPFKYGWKRELVYRATSDANLRRNGDVYYYTPSGKKVRSMREVSENLKNKELTLDDFVFCKEPLGLDDPEKEIIREAKIKTTPGLAAAVKKNKTPKQRKSPSKISYPMSSTLPLSSDNIVPKAKGSPRSDPFKIKLPGRTGRSSVGNKAKAEKKSKEGNELVVGTYPPNWSPSPPNKKNFYKVGNNLSNVDTKPCRPCSIRCQGVSGLIPTLQCRVCLCLYHNECVGLAPHTNIQGYVCKNCQLDQDPNTGSASTVAPPPPLTPINTLKSISTQSTVLPKLQRIPRTGESPQTSLCKPPQLKITVKPDAGNKNELPRLIPRPGVLTTVPKFVKMSDNTSAPTAQSEMKSIVGSVTTWFPSSSTIQVSQGSNQTKMTDNLPLQPPRPQFVEYLGDKKFLIIPKHNIVSVSPTVGAAAPILNKHAENMSDTSGNAPLGFNDSNKIAEECSANVMSALDSASLGPDSLTNEPSGIDIKTEPKSPTFQNSPIPDSLHTSLHSTDIFAEKCYDGNQKESVDETSTGCADETADSSVSSSTPTKSKRISRASLAAASEKSNKESKLVDSYLQNLAFGYNTLLSIFQYLKVQDLLRASCVCTMWRDIASHSSLWQTVRMKNSQIHNFDGLADALQKHSTAHLDLRKMLLPNNGDDIWPQFSRAIKKVESLRKIELCRCPATVVEQLALSNPKLEVINAVTIKCESMSLAPLVFLKDLQELRLKSTAGFSLTSDLTALSELKQLRHLSLTSIKDLNKLNIDVIADLRNLESLDLGECTDFPKTFGVDILIRLHKLEKLRLEKGQGNCYTFEILDAVKNMPHLEQLELVNFDIKSGFDRALGACTNIKKLLIIPTYISQSATTNHMVLGGVLRLQSTLSHFVWGVTLELLRVTELFVDQCEDPDKKEKKERRPVGNGDSIPVLKPVPLLKDGTPMADIPPAQDPPQVEILPLPNLQKLLLQSLPTTRVKILKIPFHATWRQSITDTVN